jgi:hypothetical protein
MSALPIRDKIIIELNDLSDEQAITVFEFIQSVKDVPEVTELDTEDDPLVGFISGPTDMAERTEEILKAEFGIPKSRKPDRE